MKVSVPIIKLRKTIIINKLFMMQAKQCLTY